MTIALLLPAAREFCPYADIYTDLLNARKAEYVVFEWDRLLCKEASLSVYNDGNSLAQRNFTGYMKYAFFLKKAIKGAGIKEVVVFGLPLFMALRYLNFFTEIRFAVDIRDHHVTYNFPGVRSGIDRAEFVALSSPGFNSWFNSKAPVVISHNASKLIREGLHYNKISSDITKKRVIGTIGSLKDYPINVELLNIFGGDDSYYLEYHGQGVINDQLIDYCRNNAIKNVSFTGYYDARNEGNLYMRCDYISMVMSRESVNNRTLLSNRLYNAVSYGIPLLGLSGSFLGNTIEKYGVGIVCSSVRGFKDLISVESDLFIDSERYRSGRQAFLSDIKLDNTDFEESFIKMIG